MPTLNAGTILRPRSLRNLLAGAALITGLIGCAGTAAGMTEAECLDILTSDATRKEKADACRELVRVGTANAVPVLADLLDDEQLAHMARYALEPIPDPSVDAALRVALEQLTGRLRVGVIGSVGVRRDTAAGDVLAGLLSDPDPKTVQAAARALGRLGTSEAAAALEMALPQMSSGDRPAVMEGMLRCAEVLVGHGASERAIALYDRLRTLETAPRSVRLAGLRGAVLTRGEAGLPLLLDALNSEDDAEVATAARTAQELSGDSVTGILAGTLSELPPNAQILLASSLGLRRDATAVPGLLALASSGTPVARLAAVHAVAEIGDPVVLPDLLTLQSDADREVAAAAQAALASLEGPGINEALMAMLGQDDIPVQRAAIDLIGRRRVRAAVPPLLQVARDGDASVRPEAIRVLGDLTTKDDLAALLDLLLGASAPPDLKAIEGALSLLTIRLARPDPANVTIRKAIYGDLPDGPSRDVTSEVAAMVNNGIYSVRASNGNFGDPAGGIKKRMTVEYTVRGQVRTETVRENESVEIRAGAVDPAVSIALRTALSRASGESKQACLRVLRAAGGEQALSAVRGAVEDADPDVGATAASVLAGWPTVDALPELLQLASTTHDTRTRILALRGCYRLVPLQTTAKPLQLAQIKQALALSHRPDEKRLALSALAEIDLPESLDVVLPYLRETGVAEEAGLAAVRIAEQLAEASPSLAANAAHQVLESVRNADTRTRAQAVLQIPATP